MIGVISDTHGLLRDEAAAALSGSHLILHAGDIGGAAVLDALREIAPVRAVRGNTDRDAFGMTLPVTEMLALSESGETDQGPFAYLIHDVDDMDVDPIAAGVSVVVHGHTHRPSVERRDGVLYFNPGAAGQRRFSLPISVGRLHVSDADIEAEVVELQL